MGTVEEKIAAEDKLAQQVPQGEFEEVSFPPKETSGLDFLFNYFN